VLSRRGAGPHYSEGERNDLHCVGASANRDGAYTL
jgi:hypothetical protein